MVPRIILASLDPSLMIVKMKPGFPLPVLVTSCCNMSVLFQTFFGHNDDWCNGLFIILVQKRESKESMMIISSIMLSPLLDHQTEVLSRWELGAEASLMS